MCLSENKIAPSRATSFKSANPVPSDYLQLAPHAFLACQRTVKNVRIDSFGEFLFVCSKNMMQIASCNII